MVRLKSKKTQTPANTIGAKLKKARVDKGISLEEAHKSTKILPNVLEALEQDKLEHIFGKAYVRAFIKNYAGYLGLNAKEILHEYLSKRPPESPAKPVLEQKLLLQKSNRKFSHIIIVVFAFISWLFVLSFTTVKFVQHYKRPIAAKVPESKEELPKAPAVIKSGLIPIPKQRTLTLSVATSKDAWLKVIRDGELAFHGILPKKSKETWQADKEMILSEIGKPEALSLNINGKDIDFSQQRLGRNILITHEGVDLEPKL